MPIHRLRGAQISGLYKLAVIDAKDSVSRDHAKPGEFQKTRLVKP